MAHNPTAVPGRELALIGNPNCGKTSLFNQLTGSHQIVGNWPGVTVERKTGRLQLGGGEIDVVDLPGLYSLSEGGAEDEAVARRYLSETPPGLVLNLIDARQLERQLYLTLQLIELGLPMIVLLGMSDLARSDGLAVDAAALSEQLGVPVLEVVCHRADGIASLRQQLERPWPAPVAPLAYDAMVETAIRSLQAAGLNRFEALCQLEGVPEHMAVLPEVVAAARDELAAAYADDADIAVADARYTVIARLGKAAINRGGSAVHDRGLDRWVLNRALGLPIFMLVMYLMFSWSVNVGGAFIDAFDGAAGALFVTGTEQLLQWMHAPDWLIMMLAHGLGEGVRTVAGFIPTLACLYLALGALEDCGYLARAAFVIDRLMRALGLPGRAFVPMMVGFGCNVPAIMATRTLDGRPSRILASMMIPFISCGARLPVYVLFATAFFPSEGGTVVMSLYLAGLLLAMATGLLLRPMLMRANAPAAILELPRWHRPNGRNVLRQAWHRLSGFVLGAGKLIVPMVLVVNLLSSIDTGFNLRPDAPDQSLLAAAARTVTPALEPIGIRPENWPATVGLLTGILAKEAVAGTLFASYSRLAGLSEEDGATPSVSGELSAALATIPEKLVALGGLITDPIGLTQATADASAQARAALPAMVELRERFVTPEAAYAYLLFVLLYTPCVAALSALRTEVGTGWMLASAFWTLGLAWGVAWLYRLSVPWFGVVPLLPISIALVALAGAGLIRRSPAPILQNPAAPAV